MLLTQGPKVKVAPPALVRTQAVAAPGGLRKALVMVVPAGALITSPAGSPALICVVVVKSHSKAEVTATAAAPDEPQELALASGAFGGTGPGGGRATTPTPNGVVAVSVVPL